ncbi:hypothetical protein K3495_g12764 [Podosphaera aphanis]|nr:hypothetical protein K3495_g12764 [Podosphaera aphanis]
MDKEKKSRGRPKVTTSHVSLWACQHIGREIHLTSLGPTLAAPRHGSTKVNVLPATTFPSGDKYRILTRLGKTSHRRLECEKKTCLDTIEKVQAYAEELCFHLSNAIKATGTRSKNGSGKSAPWWTPQCKTAHAEYQKSSSPLQRAERAKKLRDTINNAKKEYLTGKVESITTSANIFKLMRGSNPRQANIPPPLNHDGRLIVDQEERATILRDTLFARHEASNDLLPCTNISDDRIPRNNDVSAEEVRTCTIGCGNAAPGADGISVELLTACWKTIGPFVTQLFQACIHLGTHPSCFKLAEVVLIQKANRDPATVKGSRPIALLSCLGKELERLLAKRMAHLAITYDVVGNQ